jgi:hypothetical protein
MQLITAGAVRTGQHVTVTIDPGGLASPAFDDRTKLL